MRKPEMVRRAAEYGPDSCVSFPMAIRAAGARDEDRSLPVVVATEKPIVGVDRNCNLVDQVLLMDDGNLPDGSVPLIDSHENSSVDNTLGSVREWKFTEDPKIGRALTGRMFFGQSQRAFDAYRNYRDGHLTDVSIRAYAAAAVLRVEPGQTGAASGRTFTAGVRPTDLFVRWKAFEVSAVVRGADVDAKAQRAAELRRFEMEFKTWLSKRGLDEAGLDAVKRAELFAEFQAETARGVKPPVAPPAPPAEGAQRAEPAPVVPPAAPQLAAADVARMVAEELERRDQRQAAEETERVKKIHEVCGDELPEVERRAIAERWTVERTGAEAVKAIRAVMDSGVGAPAILSRSSEVSEQLMVDALRIKAGHGEDIVREDKEHGAQRAERAHEHRHLSLVEVCRAALMLAGVSCPRDREQMLRAAVSTLTLPKILGAVANKSVMKGYLMAAATWRAWCSVASASDFKANTGVRLTDVGDLEEVGKPGGVIQDGSLSEEYEQWTLARYAKKITLGETQILNDDQGLLSKVPQKMGDRAAALVSKLVYTHLLANAALTDSVALFHATHRNLVTGAGYKLSAGAAALRKALETFRKQYDSDGQPIDVSPAAILCAPEDEEYARSLLASIKLAEGTTAGLPTANIWGNMGMVPVVESRLSNSQYTGYSTTAWFLMGNPAQIDTVQVAFLNGQQAPRVDFFNQQEMGIDVIGVGYRVVMDAAAKALDFRGMVKMAGA